MENNPYNLEFIPIKDDAMETPNQTSNLNHTSNLRQNQNQTSNQSNSTTTPTTSNEPELSNMIQLLDGSLIEGYPIKDTSPSEYWKGMELDTTGQYLYNIDEEAHEEKPSRDRGP